jgi:hypothetical protein
MGVLLALTFGTLFSTPLQAQEASLSITVTDAETKEPLSGVTVYISQCECGGITNPSGIFVKRLEQGNYEITLDYLGYATQTLIVSLDGNKSLLAALEVTQD